MTAGRDPCLRCSNLFFTSQDARTRSSLIDRPPQRTLTPDNWTLAQGGGGEWLPIGSGQHAREGPLNWGRHYRYNRTSPRLGGISGKPPGGKGAYGGLPIGPSGPPQGDEKAKE